MKGQIAAFIKTKKKKEKIKEQLKAPEGIPLVRHWKSIGDRAGKHDIHSDKQTDRQTEMELC